MISRKDGLGSARRHSGVASSKHVTTGFRVVLDKIMLDKDPPGSQGVEDGIVIWNQTNGGINDRGSKKANVILYNGLKEVWRKDGVTLSWVEGQDKSTKLETPDFKVTRVRIEITESHGLGGGLAEIQYFRDGKNVALGGRVKASGTWGGNEDYAPSKVTDGKTSGNIFKTGYWLLPDDAAGWIQVYLVD